MIQNKHVIDLYKKVIDVCMSDGFIIEIDGKKYNKSDISYEYLIENASHIGYIESTDIPDSRMYASTTIMLFITISLDRRYTEGKGISFVPAHNGVVNLLSRTIMWNLNSGYNSALNDAKGILDKLRKNSDSLSRGV